MEKKRLVSMLLAGVMTLSLVGCGDTASAPAESGDNGAAAATEAGADAGADAGAEASAAGAGLDDSTPITLNMWCIATESDSNRKSYENAIKDMEANHPNVTLNWEAFENESYKTKIKAAVSANEMPDIFFTWSCAFLGDFVAADKVYCLDEAYEKYKSELPEVMLGNSTYDGKHYGVPLTMNIVGLFANMDLLKEAGYEEIPDA